MISVPRGAVARREVFILAASPEGEPPAAGSCPNRAIRESKDFKDKGVTSISARPRFHCTSLPSNF